MICQELPMLSLAAQFDDLCRYTNISAAGCENEFKIFVENQLSYFRSLKDTESEVGKLKERIMNLESERLKLEIQMKHVVNLCEVERTRRMQVEKEKNAMDRQLAIIRDVLLTGNNNLDDQTREKLAFLNSSCKPNSQPPPATIDESVASLFSLSDVDYTENDIENLERLSSHRRSKGKKSSLKNRISPKRKKSKDLGYVDNDLYDENRNIPLKKVRRQRWSETDGSNTETPISDPDEFNFNNYDLRSNYRESPTGSVQFNTGGRLSQMHKFSPKTVISEKCSTCHQNIKFFKPAVKCDYCKVVCHKDCKENCTLQCHLKVDLAVRGFVGTSDEDTTDIYVTAMKSPESIAAPKGTRLGPIYSGQKSLKSRNSKCNKASEVEFSSPLLK